MVNKKQKCWFCVNKDGFVALFSNEPTFNKITGKWEGKYPICNSLAHTELTRLVEHSNMTWESKPQFIEFTV